MKPPPPQLQKVNRAGVKLLDVRPKKLKRGGQVEGKGERQRGIEEEPDK